MNRMYDNPYGASPRDPTEKRKYHTFRHFTLRFPNMSKEEKIKICEDESRYKKYSHIKDPITQNKRLNTIKRNCGNNYIYETSDPNGIIKTNDRYIFYKDKVWSKSQDRYLKPITDSKGRYVLIYNCNYRYVNKKCININPDKSTRVYEKYYINTLV